MRLPLLLRRLTPGLACLAVACSAAPASAAQHPAPCANAALRPDVGTLTKVNVATLCLVNKERTKRRLTRLRLQPTLDAAADRFAKQLVVEGFFDHTAPDGTTMLDRIKATTYLKGPLRRWSVGENIAYGTGSLSTPQSIVKAWMRSPGHRANILDPSFREIGLGVSLGSPDGPDGATYVHDFGRRER
jgi:uncharacterized protein YkwD